MLYYQTLQCLQVGNRLGHRKAHDQTATPPLKIHRKALLDIFLSLCGEPLIPHATHFRHDRLFRQLGSKVNSVRMSMNLD